MLKTMASQISVASTALTLASSLYQGATGQEEKSDIFNCIKNDLDKIVNSEAGKRLIRNVGKLGTEITTAEGFVRIIKELFHLAKDTAMNCMKWSSSHPLATLAIFLLLIAALIVYIHYVPESMVAVWVNSLIQDLGVLLANLVHTLKDFAMAVAEFFKRSGLELSVQVFPTFNLQLRVPFAILETATNMAAAK